MDIFMASRVETGKKAVSRSLQPWRISIDLYLQELLDVATWSH